MLKHGLKFISEYNLKEEGNKTVCSVIGCMSFV